MEGKFSKFLRKGNSTMYKPIAIDRERLTLMGVPFPDLETLENAASGIGSNMFEGYEPTPNGIAMMRDYMLDKISLGEMLQMVRDKKYA
jgi:putative transcriptional regulator